MKEFIISSNADSIRLDKYLRKILSKAPDSFIYKMLRKKNIKLNDAKAQGNEILHQNDKINIYLSDDTFDKFSCINNENETKMYTDAYNALYPIRVVYEDEDIVIFDKPSDLLSQKARNDDISINEYLIGYLLKNGDVTPSSLKEFKPSVLNRLDRNTRGLIICSKTLMGSQIISSMIKDRSIKKYYFATCVGKIDKKLDLNDFITKDEKTNTVTVHKEQTKDCKRIRTIVKPINVYEDRTDVEIELVTGKSHQIRAHLAYYNHPLIGDPKYGNKQINMKYKANRQELTSYKLIFPHETKVDRWKDLVIEI